jgi:hypothetical protein
MLEDSCGWRLLSQNGSGRFRAAVGLDAVTPVRSYAATRANADHQERLVHVGRCCRMLTVNQEDAQRQQQLVQLIDKWFARTSAPPAEVQPGSELGDDDRATERPTICMCRTWSRTA